jgi:hypothetical protein
MKSNVNEPSTWNILGNAIQEAVSMTFLLASVLEDCNDPDEKREAIAFGIYKLQDMMRETKEIYRRLDDVIRHAQLEEDEPNRKLKLVNLH